MDLKGVLLLAFLGLLDLTPGMSILYREDIPFDSELIVKNRTVMCNGPHVSHKYSFPMYTCTNISVEGNWPLFHGINDYTEDDLTFNNNGCPGCPCGTYENENNDILGLCTAMLEAQGISKKVHTAYVPSPVCEQKKKREQNKIFRR